MTKTVLEIDLAGYSDIARQLEENLGVSTVTAFNDQIQAFVDHGLSAIKVSRDQVVMATTGDGAILVFDHPEQAHRFAQATHEAAREHNGSRNTPSAKRWFRMGAATGALDIREEGGHRKIAGITIANAVRFEGAARVGELVIDTATFDALPENMRLQYGGEEQVTGKRMEVFRARRCAMIPGETGTGAAPTVVSVLDLFDQLHPRDQLQRLMLLIEMAEKFRPSDGLPLHRRQDQILDWAAGQDGGLKRLDEALKGLIKKQRPR